MRYVMHALILAAAFGVLASASVNAEDQIFGGKVISVMENKLMMSDPAGQTIQTYTLTEGSKVTLNGKSAALGDLMMGDNLTVTIDGQKVKLVAAVRSRKV